MAFTCPRCGAVSHNPNDERERYCGRCHQWADDAPAPPDEWTEEKVEEIYNRTKPMFDLMMQEPTFAAMMKDLAKEFSKDAYEAAARGEKPTGFGRGLVLLGPGEQLPAVQPMMSDPPDSFRWETDEELFKRQGRLPNGDWPEELCDLG